MYISKVTTKVTGSVPLLKVRHYIYQNTRFTDQIFKQVKLPYKIDYIDIVSANPVLVEAQ
jgi:hypothetical protein